jgi:hypothetical protein
MLLISSKQIVNRLPANMIFSDCLDCKYFPVKSFVKYLHNCSLSIISSFSLSPFRKIFILHFIKFLIHLKQVFVNLLVALFFAYANLGSRVKSKNKIKISTADIDICYYNNSKKFVSKLYNFFRKVLSTNFGRKN